jgi:hypothetical protein
MHCRGHAHFCNNRVLHFDKSTRPEVPSLVIGAPLALRQSKAWQGTTDTYASGHPDGRGEATVVKFLDS